MSSGGVKIEWEHRKSGHARSAVWISVLLLHRRQLCLLGRTLPPRHFFARGIASGVKLEELADEGVLHVHLAHVELFVLVRSLRKELAVQVVLLVLGAGAVLASKIPRISKLLQPCSLTSFFL